jgi:protein-S-isoprenylcysteine O-methyltransferase Ste14
MVYLWRNVIDMPPVWLLAFMAAVWGQARIWNPLGFDATLTLWLGWEFIIAGLALALWAAFYFLSHKTSVVPRNTPKAMISDGPYRISRNPIYLADAMILLGFALLQGSPVGILTVPVFMAIIWTRFIKGEEAGLRATFPEEFDAYTTRTRRWL